MRKSKIIVLKNMTILGDKTIYFVQDLKASPQNYYSPTKEHQLLV